jgi:hypothetical protein
VKLDTKLAGSRANCADRGRIPQERGIVGTRPYREFMVPAPEQVDKDHPYAFSCALNLQLYASDPDPETVVVGGPGEQRSITRRESLVDIYARMVLLELGGDIDRLSAVAAEARPCLEEKPCGDSIPTILRTRLS